MKRTGLLAFCAIFGALSAASSSQAEVIYALTAGSSSSASPGGSLVTFDSATPGTICLRIGSMAVMVDASTHKQPKINDVLMPNPFFPS